VAWGSGGLLVRLLPFDMWTIVFWRGVFGTLFIGSYVLWRFAGATPDAIRRMSSSGIVITMCVTAAIAWLWLRERPSPLTMAASVLALLGIVVILGPASDGPRLGDLLAMLATAATALMTVAIRRSSYVEMLPVAGLATALSVLIAWPLADGLMALSGRDFLVAAGFGLGPMTLGMMLYVIGSALIPATLTALIGTLEAPIGALWAWVGVGEVPATATFLGGGMVLAAVFGRLLLRR
jgi:drug/metabolite transporter (DMT)-like permease